MALAGEAPEPPLQPPARPTAPGNGRDTHMAELGCADLALSVRSSLPGLVAPQLPLSPPPAPASPSTLQPCSPAPPPDHWAPPTELPQLGHPWRRPRLAPPSRVTGRLVTRGVHQLAGRRDPGGRKGGGSARGRREEGGFTGTARKGRPIPSHEYPKTRFVGEPRLLVPSSDFVASRDISATPLPPICDRLKQVLRQPLLGWGWRKESGPVSERTGRPES